MAIHSILRGRERSVFNQTTHWHCFKNNLGETAERRSRAGVCLSECLLQCHLEQNLIIIIIIIAFKGAIRDFLQSPHSAANCLQHVRSSGPSATVCKSRATHRALITCKCHVTCHLVRRDSSAVKFDRVEIAFIGALFYWLNH